ncbi:MFS transporter [Shouchella lehensis]|uniref:DHA2 family efflux MFS transporter permease subunit n=1 Tax=Shouchella lehensis TaxID=300825 RepID=A0A4Y7WMJ6_9BACI|nr:MDR family MFS transporter [Shouchella lehensis]MBG9782754.1 major facilitator transporter [Shouchella lehensis]RQW23085.1 DHA2 family efflux MFS transporter permease subunit [Bacillus sp. C1-1]TES49909.1 DHA2 family efflux MFS transporter permease subunit [Shouchella lehensis]
MRTPSLVTAGLLLGIFMAAIDNTIVATAMGTIVGDLGNYDQFVWVTAAYMVAMMAGMPIYGKLSDMYGRKRFFLFGLIVFVLGSILCGLANSMSQLIGYRVIQGIGGGALMPIAFTIIFDIFPPEKRGKMTGLIGAVFGVSSVFGPLMGAFITETLSWHWIFYINVPIGAVALYLIARHYKETLEPQKQKIDWLGASTLVIAVVCLMFALELGGEAYSWTSPSLISLFGFAFAAFIVFIFAERRADEPIISFWMFKRRLFATSQIIAFIYGSTFVVLAIFIPIFVQAVFGGSASSAGTTLMPMMIGSVVGSMTGGLLQTRIPFRTMMIFSAVCFLTGMSLLATMTPEISRVMLGVYMFLAGIGVGFSFSLLPAASINNLPKRYRGSANSTNSFLRSFGMTVGIAIFGTIQTVTFSNRMRESITDVEADGVALDPQELFTPEGRAQIPEDALATITATMSDSITFIFTLALIPISLALITTFFMGGDKVETSKDLKIERLSE